MDEMNQYSAKFLERTLHQMKCRSTKPVATIDVGCGTGNNSLPLVGIADTVFGIDINGNFVQHCKEAMPQGIFVQGDATRLHEILAEEYPEVSNQTKMIFCVGNTLGIVPPAVREAMLRAMGAACTSPSDIVVIICHNAMQFGHALQHFYGKMPQLCGSLEGAVIDFTNCTLTTKTGYYTKWTMPGEAVDMVQSLGWEVVEVKKEVKAVMVAARPVKA